MRVVDSVPPLTDQHPWGCPVYVLEPKLQEISKGIPKWEPRSRLRVYLGHSPLHAGSVALVLNPGTGHVSPQYHLVFDDEFSTVRHLRAGTVPRNWRELVESSSFSSTEEQYSLDDTWLNQNALNLDDPNSAPLISASTSPPYSFVMDIVPSLSVPHLLVSKGVSSETPIVEPPPFVSEGDATCLVSEGAASQASSQLPACEGDSLRMPEFVNLETAGLRRSAGIKKRSTKPEFVYLETAGLCRSARIKKRLTKVLEADQTLELKQ